VTFLKLLHQFVAESGEMQGRCVLAQRLSFPGEDLRMRKNRQNRTYIFNKRTFIACSIAAVLCGLIYFRSDLPALSVFAADPPESEHPLLNGSILIPDGGNMCRQRLINNATGQTENGGLVDCLDAADQNARSWKPLTDAQKATTVRKSFQ
jgi:hypothetical protein